MSEVRAVQGRKGRVVQWLVGSVLVVAAVVAAVSVHAQGRHGRSMEGGLGGGVSMFGGSPEMTAHGLDRMLDGLNATEAQRTQVRQIAMAAAAELRSLREAGRALHEKAMQIFTAPTVDAAAAESLRQQSLAQHDQASKRVLQAMLDIAKVLTPEQRARIGERMKERQAVMKDRMQRMHGMHHGPGHDPQASAPR